MCIKFLGIKILNDYFFSREKTFLNSFDVFCRRYIKLFGLQQNIFDFSNEDYIIGYDKNNKMFYFDKEDFDKIKDFYWTVNKNGYVSASSRTQTPHKFFLHRYLMNPSNDMVVDHINHCRYDNRKNNLRICTQQENMLNLNPNSKNFHAPISCHYTIDEYEYLGYFDNKKLAIKTYKKILKEKEEKETED